MITLSDQELETLLSEDVPYGDLTSISLGIIDQRARITFATRDRPVVASCTEEAVRLCETLWFGNQWFCQIRHSHPT